MTYIEIQENLKSKIKVLNETLWDNRALNPSIEKTCRKCGACVGICPVNAISAEPPGKINRKICIRCTACFAACSTNSRSFSGIRYALVSKIFEKKFSARREPEVFL